MFFLLAVLSIVRAVFVVLAIAAIYSSTRGSHVELSNHHNLSSLACFCRMLMFVSK